MNIPQLAIFDMDGLIFDSERLFMKKKHEILIQYGYPARESDYIETIGLSGQSLNNKLKELYGSTYPAAEITQKARTAVSAHIRLHGPDIKPGIQTLLTWFQSHNIPCCVASSTQYKYVKEYLHLARLDTYFADIIGGEAVTHSKPAPDIFLEAIARFHVSPADALVLEDSENGIRAALSAHIPVVCIPDMKQPEAALLAQTAATLHTADELIPFFCKASL